MHVLCREENSCHLANQYTFHAVDALLTFYIYLLHITQTYIRNLTQLAMFLLKGM